MFNLYGYQADAHAGNLLSPLSIVTGQFTNGTWWAVLPVLRTPAITKG